MTGTDISGLRIIITVMGEVGRLYGIRNIRNGEFDRSGFGKFKVGF